MGHRTIALATALVLSLAGIALAAPPDKAAPTGKPSELSQYYGFGHMEILKLQWGVGTPVLCDVNKDGLNDLVLTNNRKARVDLLLQKSGQATTQAEPDPAPLAGEDVDVNDRFGKEAAWRFKRISFPLDVEASTLALADLNHDGWLDLAYYAKGKGLYVAAQDPPAKGEKPDPKKVREPKWKPAVKIEISDGQVNDGAMAIGDLNGDGCDDVAILCGDGVSVVLQRDDGTMGKPTKYFASSERMRQVNICDVDGDKRADLVVLGSDGEYPVRVRFQSSAGQLGPEVRFEMPTPAAMSPCPLAGQARTPLLSVNARSGRVRLSALADDGNKASYPVFAYPLPAGDGAENRDVVAADVDGDGLLDVVVSDPAQAEFLLLSASAKTQLSSPKKFPGLMDMRKLCAGRIPAGPKDKSQADAVVVMSPKEKIIGISRFINGRLTFPETVTIEGEPVAMDLCDLDGDGSLDLAYVGKEKKEEKYTLRTVMAVGQKDAKPGKSVELTELKDKPLDIRCGDVDNDGRADVLVIRPYEAVLLVRRKAEGGEFEQVVRKDVQSGLLTNVFPQSLSIAPLGAKGAPAVLLAQKSFARSLVFDAAKGWKVLDQYESADPRANLVTASACKLSPKAKSTAIVAYDAARGRVAVLTEQDDRTYRTSDEIEVGQMSAKKILAGAFGGSTETSLLLCGAQKLVLMPVAAKTDLLREVVSYEPEDEKARFGEIAIGDVNSDGKPDVVLADQSRNNIEILTFNAEAKLVPATRFKVFEQPRAMERRRYDEGDASESGEPRCVLIGDVTGDGKADLVLLVHDRIVIYPQD